MKKELKITLIILGFLISIIVLDTLQAIIFKNSPIISWKKELEEDSYVVKGILIDTYYCVKEQDVVTESWHFKNSKYTCPYPEFKFYITKTIDKDSNNFHDYLTLNDRNMYLANNIEEFYIVDGKTMILKSFITNNNQTIDDSIKKLIEKLDYINELNDGGTKIYKSRKSDITLITCKTIEGNKDIYIGDSSVEYGNFMCK